MPIITLTSDLGTQDFYLAAIKGTLHSNLKDIQVIDITHQIPSFDIFKAAETSNTLKTYEKSFSLYDWIIDKYPTHERAPISLFMKGFLFDGTLKDSANASKYYTEFLTKYPNNSFAKDAELLKSNLGKSDEQVLDELMKKKAQ